MKTSTFFALAMMVFAPVCVSAQLQKANGDANIAKVAEANKKVTSIQSPFSRTVNIAAVSETKKSSGTFYFVSPSSVSMKYSDGESMVITESNVSMVGANGQSRTVKSGNHHVEDLSQTLLACVRGQVASIDGTLMSSKVVGKTIVFKINADLKVGRSKYNSLELTYDSSDCTLVSINLKMADGSYMLYELAAKSLNKPIDNSVFAVAKPSSRKSGK